MGDDFGFWVLNLIWSVLREGGRRRFGTEEVGNVIEAWCYVVGCEVGERGYELRDARNVVLEDGRGKGRIF